MSQRTRESDDRSTLIEWVLKPAGGAAPLRGEPDRPERPPPGILTVLFGIVLPFAVIATELATRMCAEAFFDPMPTPWHTLLVASVPAANLLFSLKLRAKSSTIPFWYSYISGATLAISAFYALLFLPLLPVALIAVLFYGLGLLPMGPLASFLVAWALKTRLAVQSAVPRFNRRVLIGAVAGFAALIALDVPQAATRLGVQWAVSSDIAQRERGLTLLRTLGDQPTLLRLCYNVNGKPGGLLSLLVTFGGAALLDAPERRFARSTADVREVFFRAYGVPFNALPRPQARVRVTRAGDFSWDGDHGGTQVGGQIAGLGLVSSRMDASVSADAALAYLEWTIAVRNKDPLDREARFVFALPTGAVVSRATLWIDGVEQEAAFGGRGAVRKAYTDVAVRQRRDPLLVTTKGAGRVLAQAFPVPRNGGTLKFKIGMTAPLALDTLTLGRLTLPALLEHNFDIPDDEAHAIWIESKQALSANHTPLVSSQTAAGGYRIGGMVKNGDLSEKRPQIVATRAAGANRLIAQTGEQKILQIIAVKPVPDPGTLMIVVDGSVGLGKHRADLSRALDAIPTGQRVGLIIAGVPLVHVPAAPWEAGQVKTVREALDDWDFVGGQDNSAALAEALTVLEGDIDATLLWVHGPQPITFRRTAALLEQVSSRLSRFPKIALYAPEHGPLALLPDVPWAWAARPIPSRGSVRGDLAQFFESQRAGRMMPIIERNETSGDGAADKGSPHIARLWAAERVQDMILQSGDVHRAEAIALATGHQLVTPVSGAVVLETKAQYETHNLKPVAKGTVPTVPEPHEWLMIVLLALSALWVLWRHSEMSRFRI